MKFKAPSFLLLILFFWACSEDEPAEAIVITASDLVVTLAENPGAGQSLGTIQASVNVGELMFEITDQSMAGAFAIDASTGEVSVANPTLFDFESTQELTAEVTLTSGNATELVDVTATITDVSDATITASDFEVSIDENPEEATLLGTIDASTDQGSLSFRLGEQGNPEAFLLDESSGALTVADSAIFDFERFETLTAVAFIAVGEVEQFIDIRVSLNNINEISAPDRLTASIQENVAFNTDLLTVEATADIGSVQYELTSSSVAEAVKINNNSGILKVNDPAAFDYETNTTITGVVTVTAEAARSVSVDFEISIEDVIELSLLEQALVYLPLDDEDLSNARSNQFDGEERGEGLSVYVDRHGNDNGAIITGNQGGFSIPDWNQKSEGTSHNGAFTIALWMRIEEATTNRRTRPIWEFNCGEAPALGLFIVNEINQNAGRLFVRQGSPTGAALASYNNNPIIGLNNTRSPWVFVAISYEEGESLTYKIISDMNGSLNFTQTITGSDLIYAPPADQEEGLLTFGLRTCSSSLTVPTAIDDVVIYDRALSVDEIEALHAELND